MSEVVIGIDLGTTNSLVAHMTAAGPEVIRDAGGNGLVPSVVSFLPDGSALVGDAANQRRVSDPTTTVHSVKRLMGKGLADLGRERELLPYPLVEAERKLVRVQVGAQAFTPQEISARILKVLKDRATSF